MVRPLLALIKDNNFSYMECIANFYAMIVHLHLGNLHAVQQLLDRNTMLVNTAQHADMAWLYLGKCWYAFARGDRVTALSHGKAALQAAHEIGALLVALDISCFVAMVCCESGELEASLEYLAIAKNQGIHNSPRLSKQVLQIEAYVYLEQGNHAKGRACLRQAFAIGRTQYYFGSIWCWFPKNIMSRLCAEALRADIETYYAEQLIRKHGLLPEDPTLENWPWSIRVYTLGQSRVEIDGQALIADTKAQRKPLGLLEVLIALGGTDVKEERITEILWPDADGDAAHSAFTTTLSRLRKLIGEETVKVKNSRVSLDERRCWVDIREFEYLLDRADKAAADSAAVRTIAEKLMALYRGPFLSDEEQEWPKRVRNRLRAKFSRFLAQGSRTLSAAGDMAHALPLFEQALESDPGAEDFYRCLITVYAGSGQDADTLVGYSRCREILSRHSRTSTPTESEQPFQVH
jgi:DNA-binding SARP family transcriptional activator